MSDLLSQDFAVKVGCMKCGLVKMIRPIECSSGQLVCSKCERLISIVDPASIKGFVEKQVERKRRLQESGELQTRIQTTIQDDQASDRDGRFAEFASCIAICPNRLSEWTVSVASNEKNRGSDLPAEWTGLSKPIEIKFTRYFSEKSGYLIIRPPSGECRFMKPEFVDDAFYILLTLRDNLIQILGWIDRNEFIAKKKADPVGRKGKQIECWGVHWKDLIGLSKLERPKRVSRL